MSLFRHSANYSCQLLFITFLLMCFRTAVDQCFQNFGL